MGLGQLKLSGLKSLFRPDSDQAAAQSPCAPSRGSADLLEACLPNIWQELRLPGTPFPQGPGVYPTRAEVESTYRRLDAALWAHQSRGLSPSPALDAWLRQAGTAQACMRGVWIGARLGGGPNFIAHPSPQMQLPAYMDALLTQRVATVVALGHSPWWVTTPQDHGSVHVVPTGRKVRTLGRPAATVEVTETAVRLSRGEEQHSLRVIQIPWQDFGVPHPRALAQSITLAKARAGSGVMAVHCGAGLGRTGTFIAAAELIRERAEGPPGFGPHGQAVMAFLWTRMHRPGAVETPHQFVATLGAALAHERH